jgi:hypothetical protein
MIEYFRAKADWTFTVERVFVERETDMSVWMNGHQIRKQTQGTTYHKTFEEAKQHLMVVEELKARRHENIAAEAREKLEAASKLEIADVQTSESRF